MTSKKYSEGFMHALLTLMREDVLHRIYLFAISVLSGFFLYPVGALMIISRAQNDAAMFYQGGDVAKGVRILSLTYFRDFYTSGTVALVLVALSIPAALTGFAYLMRSNRADFFHALPFRRPMLFAAAFMDGFIIVMLPFILLSFVSALMVSARTGDAYPAALMAQLLGENISGFLLCYSVSVLAVMLTGQIFAAMMAALIFFFYAPWLGIIFRGLAENCFKTIYYDDLENIGSAFERFSPLSVFVSGDGLVKGALLRCIICLVVAAILIALSCRLYCRRPLEKAGSALVFDCLRFPVKLFITVPASLTGALFLGGILDKDIWKIFGLVCALIIVHCIMEIVYNADFRKLFAHKRQCLICLMAAVAIFLFYRLDMSGYDRYLPGEDKLADAGVSCYELESNIWSLKTQFHMKQADFDDRYDVDESMYDEASYIDEMHVKDIKAVLELGSMGIEETARRAGLEEEELYEDDGMEYTEIVIAYHLKDGNTVRRKYMISLSEAQSVLDRIHDSQGFKEASYPVMGMVPEEIARVSYTDIYGKHLVGEDQETISRLLEAYTGELSDLTMNKRRNEAPLYCIQFLKKEVVDLAQALEKQGDYFDYILDYGYYPVYPSFKKTLGILKEYGGATCDRLMAESFSSISLTYNGEALGGTDNYMEVVDPEQIQELLDACDRSLDYDNSARKVFYELNISAMFSTQEIEKAINDPGARISRSINLYITWDNVPWFVRDYFDMYGSGEDAMGEDVYGEDVVY